MTTVNMAIDEILKHYGIDRPEAVDAICGELIKQLKYADLSGKQEAIKADREKLLEDLKDKAEIHEEGQSFRRNPANLDFKWNKKYLFVPLEDIESILKEEEEL